MMILDEGFINLDESHRGKVGLMLDRILESRSYIIMISHLEELRKHINRECPIELGNSTNRIIIN